MSKFIKTAAALIVFGAFSTVTMAGGNHHPKPDPKPTPVCNEGPCTGSIPIQVIVPKRCELKVKTPSISLKDGAEASGQFMVGRMQTTTYWSIPTTVLVEAKQPNLQPNQVIMQWA